MPIWTSDLPGDVQPNLVLDLFTLSVVTAPGTESAITVEADESLDPLLGVIADGAKVSIHQIALVGHERFAGIWPWGPQTSRVRVTVPHGTHLDTRLDTEPISAEHSWKHMQVRTSAGSIRLGDCVSTQAYIDAGSIIIGALHEGSVWVQAGSVRVRSTSGTMFIYTEADSVKVVEARGGTLDLSSKMGTVSVEVPGGTAILADCHSDLGRIATDLSRQKHPDAFERRFELRTRTQMETARVRRT